MRRAIYCETHDLGLGLFSATTKMLRDSLARPDSVAEEVFSLFVYRANLARQALDPLQPVIEHTTRGLYDQQQPDRSWRARGISGDSLKSAKPDGLNGGAK
jgi:hypothetical protein